MTSDSYTKPPYKASIYCPSNFVTSSGNKQPIATESAHSQPTLSSSSPISVSVTDQVAAASTKHALNRGAEA